MAALLDYKAQLNEKNLDSKGSTSSRQILNSNLTDSQIDNAEFEINNEGSCQSSNKIKQTNNKTPKSNINKAMMSELGIAEDLGFDELEDLKNEEIRKEKLANYEYYTDYDEDDL